VLIIAPHGGRIERGTSQLAALIAGDEFSLYRFEGFKPLQQNRDLHITSHNFDEPVALRLASRSTITLGIHGCKGKRAIFVGGLDLTLKHGLTRALKQAGFPASSRRHEFPATHPLNICNRGKRAAGAQLEITLDLRLADESREAIARAARQVLARHLASLKAKGLDV
jgi:phage replication-related protein YjqB (UPF0714/DUF867 family)